MDTIDEVTSVVEAMRDKEKKRSNCSRDSYIKAGCYEAVLEVIRQAREKHRDDPSE